MDRRRAVLCICILLGLTALWLVLRERATAGATDTAPSRAHAPYVPDADLRASLQGTAGDAADADAAPDDGSRKSPEPDDRDADKSEAKQAMASLTVVAVDGMTGRHVRGTWRLQSGAVNWAGKATEEEARLLEQQPEPRLWDPSAKRDTWEPSFLPTGTSRARALSPGTLLDAYAVRLPSGYVLDDPILRAQGAVAAGATRTRVVLPVWREAVLDLTVRDPQGRPATGVTIERLYAAGRLRDVQLETLGPGRYRVRGIPALAGEPTRAILLWVETPDDEKAVDSEVESVLVEEFTLGDLSGKSPQINTVIPSDPALRWHVRVDLTEERRAEPLDSIEFGEMVYEETFGTTLPSGVQFGTVRIRALGWDGLPIVGTKLLGETTDADGTIRTGPVAASERTFHLDIPGRLIANATVTVEADKTTEITLREPLGARLRVYVSDTEGRPRPSARLDLGDQRWFDVNDGVQRLDLHTDANGRRTLARVQPGKFTLRATWGDRKGEHVIELKDGETTSVHIITK